MRKLILISTVVVIVAVAVFLLQQVPPVGEGPNEAIKEVEKGIVGRWVSLDDPNYISQIKSDGSYEEFYDGKVVDDGSWAILNTLEGEDFEPKPDFEDGFYLKKTDENEELFYYYLFEYGGDELVLSYLARGNTLSFVREDIDVPTLDSEVGEPKEEVENVQIANPASVNCIDKGGTLEIREGNGGSQGICILEGGVECEEWAFFRGECPPKIGGNTVAP